VSLSNSDTAQPASLNVTAAVISPAPVTSDLQPMRWVGENGGYWVATAAQGSGYYLTTAGDAKWIRAQEPDGTPRVFECWTRVTYHSSTPGWRIFTAIAEDGRESAPTYLWTEGEGAMQPIFPRPNP
jgi:hypothetical protein